MIALARVDLPEPLGPISACTLPFSTSRSSPRRISLSSALTCRLRISSSANVAPFLGFLKVCRSGGGADRRLARSAGTGTGEFDQLCQRRAREGLADTALHPRPEQLGRAGAVAVVLVRTEDFSVRGVVKALHWRDLSFERF